MRKLAEEGQGYERPVPSGRVTSSRPSSRVTSSDNRTDSTEYSSPLKDE